MSRQRVSPVMIPGLCRLAMCANRMDNGWMAWLCTAHEPPQGMPGDDPRPVQTGHVRKSIRRLVVWKGCVQHMVALSRCVLAMLQGICNEDPHLVQIWNVCVCASCVHV
eukprot:scaffold143173_cov20-Tisochrysis_lutea.AAC.2